MRPLLSSLLLLCAALAVTPACGPRGAALTPAEVQAHGTHRFAAPPGRVFAATVTALKLEGYEVALSRPEEGSIKTNRKVVRADAVGNQYAVTAVEIARQYEITVEADGDGGTKVTATPRVFVGEAEVSDQAVWQLEGPAGERTLWKRLFEEIDETL